MTLIAKAGAFYMTHMTHHWKKNWIHNLMVCSCMVYEQNTIKNADGKKETIFFIDYGMFIAILALITSLPVLKFVFIYRQTWLITCYDIAEYRK